MFRMYVVTSSCLGKALMLSIYSSAFLPYCGIVQGVFRQQAGGAWFPCRGLKLAITVLMPQSSEPHHWFGRSMQRRFLANGVSKPLSMSYHQWGTLNPDWRSGHWWLRASGLSVLRGRFPPVVVGVAHGLTLLASSLAPCWGNRESWDEWLLMELRHRYLALCGLLSYFLAQLQTQPRAGAVHRDGNGTPFHSDRN